MHYQIGQTVINKKPEIDCDNDDNERVTPAGSHWEIMRDDEGMFSIECRATGGWLFMTAAELQRDFEVPPSVEDQLKAALKREAALLAQNQSMKECLADSYEFTEEPEFYTAQEFLSNLIAEKQAEAVREQASDKRREAEGGSVIALTKKAYLVWNPEACEGQGVVFTDEVDAKYASTGKDSFATFGVPMLAEHFRETHACDDPNKVFPIIDIEVPDASN